MISREDLKNISISLGEDYGGGWQDYDLYYKGKHIATYRCSGRVRMDINEEVYSKLEVDEQVEKELREFYPISMLSEDQMAEAKKIAKESSQLEAIKYIRDLVPSEGLKGAKAYFDLYLDDRNN